nr:hypothetical protein [Curtobacterium ammoniigenes]
MAIVVAGFAVFSPLLATFGTLAMGAPSTRYMQPLFYAPVVGLLILPRLLRARRARLGRLRLPLALPSGLLSATVLIAATVGVAGSGVARTARATDRSIACVDAWVGQSHEYGAGEFWTVRGPKAYLAQPDRLIQVDTQQGCVPVAGQPVRLPCAHGLVHGEQPGEPAVRIACEGTNAAAQHDPVRAVRHRGLPPCRAAPRAPPRYGGQLAPSPLGPRLLDRRYNEFGSAADSQASDALPKPLDAQLHVVLELVERPEQFVALDVAFSVESLVLVDEPSTHLADWIVQHRISAGLLDQERSDAPFRSNKAEFSEQLIGAVRDVVVDTELLRELAA